MDKKEAKPFVLPSLFGLHRGWTVIFAFVLFFLLLGIVPSLFHMGRRVHFSASYYPFALSVDDKDMYLVPGDVYLKPGHHTAYMHINGKVIAETSFSVRPSLFYSWLFEGKKQVFIKVSDERVENVYDDIVAFFLTDAALYALYFEETPVSQIRPIYSDIKHQLPPFLYEKALDTISLAARLISSEELKVDAEENGIPVNYHKMSGEIEKTVQNVQNEQNVQEKRIDGVQFVGNSSFWVSENQITEKEFYEFLKDEPYYDASNVDTLMENEECDELYLSGFTISENKSVTNISYRSALAFASWFSRKYNVNALIASEEALLSFKDRLVSNKTASWEFTSTVFDNASFNDGRKCDFSVFEKYGITLSAECINLNSIKTNGDEITYPVGAVVPYLSYPTMGFRLMIKEAL